MGCYMYVNILTIYIIAGTQGADRSTQRTLDVDIQLDVGASDIEQQSITPPSLSAQEEQGP